MYIDKPKYKDVYRDKRKYKEKLRVTYSFNLVNCNIFMKTQKRRIAGLFVYLPYKFEHLQICKLACKFVKCLQLVGLVQNLS